MKVRDVMSTEVVVVAPDTPFQRLVAILIEKDLSGVPVVDEAGALVGIVTEADLLSKEAFGERARTRILRFLDDLLHGREAPWIHKATGIVARDVMSGHVATATANEDVAAVARRALRLGFKRLPVLDGDRLVGVVTRHDLLRVFDRSDGDIALEARGIVERYFVDPKMNVHVVVLDGIVTVGGEVQHERDAKIVGHLLSGISGVVAVQNLVRFREPDVSYTAPPLQF